MRFALCLFLLGLLPWSLGQATVHIPLSKLSHEGATTYAASVVMAPTAPQNFSFAVTLGSGYTAVQGTACDACGIPAYDSSKSPSVQDVLDPSGVVDIAGKQIRGRKVRENCTVAKLDGTPWSYPNQTIIVTDQSGPGSIYDLRTSGIIGLGSSRSQNGNISDSFIGGWLTRNSNSSSFTFGLCLRCRTRTSSTDSGGLLHMVKPDPSKYDEASTVYTSARPMRPLPPATPENPVPADASVVSDWIVELLSWGVDAGTRSHGFNSATEAILELSYTPLVLPRRAAQSIAAEIPGAVLQPDNGLMLPNGARADAWTVPCDTNIQFNAVFGGRTFSASNLIQRLGSDSCLMAIQGWPDDTSQKLLLGAAFLEANYIIFQLARDGEGTVGFAPYRMEGLPPRTLIGIIVGSVVGALILSGIGIWFLMRRLKRRNDKDDQTSSTTHKTILTSSSPPQSPTPQHRRPSPLMVTAPHSQPLYNSAIASQHLSPPASATVSHYGHPQSVPPSANSETIFFIHNSSGPYSPALPSSSGPPSPLLLPPSPQMVIEPFRMPPAAPPATALPPWREEDPRGSGRTFSPAPPPYLSARNTDNDNDSTAVASPMTPPQTPTPTQPAFRSEKTVYRPAH